MNEILTKAKKFSRPVVIRAIAHEKSAEWHRHMGEKLGGIATALSALLGTTIFATFTSQLGRDGQGHISLPSGGWALLGYAVFVLILIDSLLLTGLQTFLNNAEQTESTRSLGPAATACGNALIFFSFDMLRRTTRPASEKMH